MIFNNSSSRQQGFTLLELMIVVAIIGVFFSLAIPNVVGMMHRRAVSSLHDTVVGVITQARIGAMQTGQFVAICPSDDITVATPVCTNWTSLAQKKADGKKGWVVFKNNAKDGAVADAQSVLSTLPFDDFSGRTGIVSDTNGNQRHLLFNRKGNLTGGARTITIGGDSHYVKEKRQVVVAAVTGRIRSQRSS